MNLKNCIIDKLETKKDWSVKIILYTRSLDPKQAAELFLNLNQEILSVDIPEDQSDNKSPSQRLRSVFYILWEQWYKETFSSFSLFYDHIMEKTISYYKDKLEPNNN
jgi:hypothetical protein